MIMEINFKFDTDNPEDVRAMQAIHAAVLNLSQTDVNTGGSNAGAQGGVSTQPSSQIAVLNAFYQSASQHQRKVLDWMKINPGIVNGNDLKAIFSFLQGRGLAGVFKKARWVQMGGVEQECPFYQVTWDGDHGVGVYRGLSADEASQVNW